MARGAYLRSPVSPSSILPLSSPPGTRGILVTDFDGTITTGDFFELVRRRWPQVPDPWDQALAGAIPMREALRRIFAGARGTRDELLSLCEQSGVGLEFGDAFRQLQQAGWRIIVASAGCDFYIHHTLGRVGVQAEVVAHRGDIHRRGRLDHAAAGRFAVRPSPFRAQ
jgi:2-hydroxy-3-keto-5-methylthiopentenyl-1-phosphate phosphatase